MALLAQSRGSLLGFAAAAVVALVATGDRWRLALVLLVVVADVALSSEALLHVRDASSVDALVAALRAARTAIAVSCAAAMVAGAAAIVGARRMRGLAGGEEQWASRADRALAALAAAGVAASLVAVGDPLAWVRARWADFRSAGYSQVDVGASRFGGSLGSGRYDFYRVALDQWREHPLFGIGYENFQVPYLISRRTTEAPVYAHSLMIGVLAGTGLVGALLLIAALGWAAAGVLASLRAHPEVRGLAAGPLAGVTGWLVHAQTDWLWEFPSLGILAFALLGLTMRAGDAATAGVDGRGAAEPRRTTRTAGRRRLAATVLAVGAAALLSALGVAGHLSSAAYDEAGTDPAAAIAALTLASRLEPLSAGPLITRGILARRIGRAQVAADSLRAAVGREPENWFAQLELGMLDADDGERAAGLAALRRARELNPGEPVIAPLVDDVEHARRIDAAAVEGALYEEMDDRLDPLGAG